MPTITQKEVLNTLNNKHGGIIQGNTGGNPLHKLLQSMGRPYGQKEFLLNTLESLRKRNEIVVEDVQGRIVTIATPAALKAQKEAAFAEDNDIEGDTMATPAGLRMTTHARTAEGHALPGHLTDDMVGELTVTYTNPDIDPDLKATADLVIDELRQHGKPLMARADILAMIQAIAQQLGDSRPMVIEAISQRIFNYLVSYKILAQAKQQQSSRNKVYELKLPEVISEEQVAPPDDQAADLTDTQLIAMLIETGEKLQKQLEEANENRANLQKRVDSLECATKDHIDPDAFNRLLQRAEQLDEDLKVQKKAHETSLAELRAEHERAMSDQQSAHQSALDDCQGELDTAKAEVKRLEAELGTNKGSTTLDNDTKARLKKLGVNL